SLPPPEPTVSYLDDLEFFKEFENEFPAIVYDDALTSKSDLLTEPILSPRHIDEFDLNDETSMSEYGKEEQNILYFNDLFPFNIIHPDELNSEKDNDNNEIDIIQSSEDMAPLPPRDQRHLWLCYQVEGYTEEIVHDFDQRLETIFERMRMVYTRDDGQEVLMSHAWRRLFGIRAPLVQEFILKFFSTCRIRDEMGLDVAGTLCFQMGGARRSMTWSQFILALGLHTAEEMAEDRFSAYWDFLRGAPSYTYIRDPVRRLCHRLISYSISGRGQAPEKVTATDLFYLHSMDRGAANVLYLLAQYLFRHAEGIKSSARLSEGYFIRRLAHHFGLVSDDGLRGLSVVARELPLNDMGELVKLNIYMDLGDDWACVASGPERHQAAGLVPLRPLRMLLLLLRRLGRLEEELIDASGLTYLEFDGTFSGSSPAAFQRRTRQRLARPAPPQHSRTHNSQTHDPSYPYLLIKPGSKFSTIVHEYVTEPSRIFTPKCRMEKGEMISNE
ncbi:hypothetical protein Tco_1388123, partial [Tanacetum coccineum]